MRRTHLLARKRQDHIYRDRICPDRMYPGIKQRLIDRLHEAWAFGLFAAKNGNASLRYPKPYDAWIAITASGTCKGHMRPSDISLLHTLRGDVVGAPISSESHLHLRCYEYTACAAVVHSHPPCLLALSLRGHLHALTDLPLYEAKRLPPLLSVPPNEPGSDALAMSVTATLAHATLSQHGALWLCYHGLCTFGASLEEAFSLTEAFEHLAYIALHAEDPRVQKDNA